MTHNLLAIAIGVFFLALIAGMIWWANRFSPQPDRRSVEEIIDEAKGITPDQQKIIDEARDG